MLAQRAPGFERLDDVEQTLDEVERTVLGVAGKQQQKRGEIGEETDQQRIGRHQLAIALCGVGAYVCAQTTGEDRAKTNEWETRSAEESK